MSSTNNHVLKNIQLALTLANTYTGKIDGIWGPGSERAAQSFFNTVKNGPASVVPMRAWADFEELVKIFQTNARAYGFYSLGIDGIWGNGSKAALASMVKVNRVVAQLPDLKCAWSNKVCDEFIAILTDWVNQRGYSEEVVDYVMSVMAFETGRTFSPSIQNQGGSNAFGLLQFMRPAATDLGFTLDEIKSMEQLEQLKKCVLPYFDMRAKRRPMKNLEDFYLAVLYPALVGKGMDEILFSEGTVGYSQNRGLDRNNDGHIYVHEIADTIYNVYYEGMKPSNRRPYNG